jgi:hypothetical protein
MRALREFTPGNSRDGRGCYRDAEATREPSRKLARLARQWSRVSATLGVKYPPFTFPDSPSASLSSIICSLSFAHSPLATDANPLEGKGGGEAGKASDSGGKTKGIRKPGEGFAALRSSGQCRSPRDQSPVTRILRMVVGAVGALARSRDLHEGILGAESRPSLFSSFVKRAERKEARSAAVVR